MYRLTIEGMFLLGEKTAFVMMCSCAVLVEVFVMLCTEPKTLPVWITLIKISDNKDRKKFHVREYTACVCVSSAETIVNSQRVITLKS